MPDISTKLGPELKSTVEILEQGPSIGIQERLTQSWQASSSELAGWLEIITKRATQLERELDRLVGLRATWAQTRTDAQASRAPTPVLQNVETVLADIEAARVRCRHSAPSRSSCRTRWPSRPSAASTPWQRSPGSAKDRWR